MHQCRNITKAKVVCVCVKFYSKVDASHNVQIIQKDWVPSEQWLVFHRQQWDPCPNKIMQNPIFLSSIFCIHELGPRSVVINPFLQSCQRE
jgi:hypothetical protein